MIKKLSTFQAKWKIHFLRFGLPTREEKKKKVSPCQKKHYLQEENGYAISVHIIVIIWRSTTVFPLQRPVPS